MILKVGDEEKEVGCEIEEHLPEEGEFELKGEPVEVEKCWRKTLWAIRGKKYVLSYEVKPGVVKGWVIVRRGKPVRPIKPKKAKRKEVKRKRLKERLKTKRRSKKKGKGGA